MSSFNSQMRRKLYIMKYNALSELNRAESQYKEKLLHKRQAREAMLVKRERVETILDELRKALFGEHR